MQMRRELLTWQDVDQLIDHLIPQFEREYDSIVMITRGGIIPGGILAEAMGITHVLTAAVDFPTRWRLNTPSCSRGPSSSSFPQMTNWQDITSW